MGGKPLTGRAVLIWALGGFGAILAANLSLVYAALDTFPGVEVANGYVASQSFERERKAQDALGWKAVAEYRGGRLTLDIRDAADGPAPVADLRLKLGRPTTEADDIAPQLVVGPAGWTADLPLAPGRWRLDIEADGAGAERFRQTLHLEVRA